MRYRPSMPSSAAVLAIAALVCFFTACTAAPEQTVVQTFATGQYGKARVALYEKLPEKPQGGNNIDRHYMLEHLRTGVLTMADGYPQGVGPVFDRVYDILRLQGVNKDQGVSSVVLNEDLKVWKGEPFEQALAYIYIASQYASQGSWDNVRAAAGGALFHLRDFGTAADGRPLNTEAVVTQASKADPESADLPSYQIDESNFALAHVMSGIANWQLGRADEARAQFQQAVRIDGQLQSLADVLLRGDYNTVLLVDYGQGPQKIGTGPDQAIAAFVPVTPSDNAPLLAEVNGNLTARVPIVCDVNQMAMDHRWNNLEDMRIAKSHVGSALMITGGALAGLSDSSEAQLVGVGLLLGGLFAKAGAHADTRYCEAMPQRLYVLPLKLNDGDQVTLTIQGQRGSQITLPVMDRQRVDGNSGGGGVTFRFVRMQPSPLVQGWQRSSDIIYSNEYAKASSGLNLPYILGGQCVRPPSQEVLEDYQRSGYLRGMTFNELRDLYLEEGIVWEESAEAYPGLHVLEGGNSLASPWPGTAGYKRLFCTMHPPYHAKSEKVRNLARDIASQLQR